MLAVFLKLLLCHILGDFVLQPKSWVAKRKDRIVYLFLHVVTHMVLLMVFFSSDFARWWPNILLITFGHLAIDSLKIWWERMWPYKPVLLFIVDQILHIALLVVVIIHMYGVPDQWTELFFTSKSLLYLIAFLLVTAVSPIFLRVFFSKWNQESDFYTKRKDTLMDAGMLIGIMERLIIVLFIQVNFLSGIGFLLAAKSVFRFGDLTNAKDTKFTEYILVGTLASFVIAIAIGYGLRFSLQFV
ncbi:DUF3307 domain-containing protein [Sphingobacterium alkalisoli]|uniref:DUF3307 domain-containing protein n=1 Tax=Sphingobacterium alkalisoli TaxID=1874115 RepID=A0A4U0GUH7_9SPHI|nr:DUF3307 domain-containing protein [Sphingobacterium alkalisoli]TJY62663.1 DUF3307 domain-containing protein [Sphingobacterium alkalisoli]GGH28084.1 hypothetical protein GCM10011418_38460 [Sphingobacterium alkalisoli]